MMEYTIKIDVEKQRVLFSGVTWGYGVGCELPLWEYREHSGLVVVKVIGASDWSSRGQSSYSPAEFMVLRVTEQGKDGWVQAEQIIRFPIRKPTSTP